MFLSLAYNGSVFAMAGHFVFRQADTEADFYFVAEDNHKCSIAYCLPITKADKNY